MRMFESFPEMLLENTGNLYREKHGTQNAPRSGDKNLANSCCGTLHLTTIFILIFSEWPGYNIIFKNILYTWDDIFRELLIL